MATTTPIDRPPYQARIVYDTAAIVPIVGADANHSILIASPRLIQIDTLPAATSVQIQQKVHAAAEWNNVGAAIAATTQGFVVFDHPPNFVQLVRTGAGAVKAYAQGAVYQE